MAIDISDRFDKNDYDENYPLLQDVMDAAPGEMKGLKSFLPAWKGCRH